MSEKTTIHPTAEDVRHSAEAALPAEVVTLIRQAEGRDHPKSLLISVLQRVQNVNGYLSPETMDAVAQLMQIPAATVTGVATFYHLFRLRPRGKFVISVCLGTACYVKGAQEVFQKFRDELGIDVGETTSDGQFTLAASRCLGTCGLAPVVMINDEVHAKVTPSQVPALLEACAKQQ